MIQQVSNTRSDKYITNNDLRNITYASCLNFFHTNTMFYPWPFGVFYSVYFYWVKRINNNNYSFQECWATTEKQNMSSPASINARFSLSGTTTVSHLEELHHDLICKNDGEERLLIICAYRRASNFHKSLLGFYILEPKSGGTSFLYSRNTKAFFEYKIVITPKPGLFSDK